MRAKSSGTPRPGTARSSKRCQNTPVAQLTGWPLEHTVAFSLPFGGPPCSPVVGPPANTIALVSDSSSEKYADAPGAIPGEKCTMPPDASGLMSEKLVPGPSYPVGPKGHPAGAPDWEQRPSPSNPNRSVFDDRASDVIVPPELFTTPVSVSSMPSYGGWLGSLRTAPPLSVTTTSTPQLVSCPSGGHSVKGGDVGAAAAAAPKAPEAPSARDGTPVPRDTNGVTVSTTCPVCPGLSAVPPLVAGCAPTRSGTSDETAASVSVRATTYAHTTGQT